MAGLGEGDGEVERRGRLGDAALLVGEGDHLGVLRGPRARLLRAASCRAGAISSRLRSLGLARRSSSSGARPSSCAGSRPRSSRLACVGRLGLGRAGSLGAGSVPLGHARHPLGSSTIGAAPRRRRLGLVLRLRNPIARVFAWRPRFSCRRSKLLGICPMPELLDKRLVFVTGKGGVGKTTVAVALGLRAAAGGQADDRLRGRRARRTPRASSSRAEVGFHEVEMAENLWAISIDPDESMREYLLLQLKVRAMRDMLFRSRIFNYLAAATPGPQGAGHDREDLGAGPARPQGQEGAQVRPGDRRRAGHRPRDRLPADAAHLRRASPGSGRSTPRRRQLDRFITDHEHDRRRRSSPCPRRCRSTSPRRWSATLRERRRRRRRPRLHERALPGALLQGRGRAARGGARRAARRRRARRRAARRSPSTGRAALPARPARRASTRPCRGAGQDAALPLRARARRRRGRGGSRGALG